MRRSSIWRLHNGFLNSNGNNLITAVYRNECHILIVVIATHMCVCRAMLIYCMTMNQMNLILGVCVCARIQFTIPQATAHSHSGLFAFDRGRRHMPYISMWRLRMENVV